MGFILIFIQRFGGFIVFLIRFVGFVGVGGGWECKCLRGCVVCFWVGFVLKYL